MPVSDKVSPMENSDLNNDRNLPHTFSSIMSEEALVSAGTFTFRSSSHFLVNGEKLKKLYADSQLCDVHVKCSDGSLIPAHRVVLAASSDYFAAMFTGSMNESRQNEIVINGVEPNALHCLITYCYTGEILLTESSVESLLSAACLLQLSDVVDACSDYLLNQLHPSNCLGIRNFADAQGCEKLKQFADNFTTDKFSDVVHQAEFLLLPPDDLLRLLSSDELNVPCEAVVYRAVLTWLRHDLVERRRFAASLLGAVRLGALSPRFLAEQVDGEPILANDHACQALLSQAYKHHLLPDTRPSGARPRKSTAGALYVVGGMDANKGALTIERFHYVKNQWLTVGHISNRRLQFGVAVLENKIFVVGGREGLKALNGFECWDSETGSWSPMVALNAPRHGLAVAVLENIIYAIGGHDGWSYLSSVERWYPGSKSWTPVAEMNTARSGAGVAVLDGKIYVFGGRDGSQCLRTAEFYSPHTNKWSPICSMNRKRGSVGAGVLHGYIYVVGGLESPSCNGAAALTRYQCVERYDPKTDQWAFVANLSIGRDGVAVCMLGDRLFAIGGYSGLHYLPIVEVYDDESNEWSKVNNLSNGRAGACAAVIPNKVEADCSAITTTNNNDVKPTFNSNSCISTDNTSFNASYS